jgi:hypothetical protein
VSSLPKNPKYRAFDDQFSRQERMTNTHVEVIVHNHHGCITARALTLDFDDGKQAILGSLTGLDTKMIASRLENIG